MVTTASGHGSVQVLIVIIIIIVISVIIIIIIIIIILGELIGWYDWGPGQPQPGRDQHCLYVVGGWLGYQWADFHCDFQVKHPSNMPFELNSLLNFYMGGSWSKALDTLTYHLIY